jgi:protein SCO1/2
VAIVSIAVIAVVGALALWATASPSQASRSASSLEYLAPGRPLLGHDGEAFSFDRLLGKTVLLNFIFTRCPSVCPTQTKALMRVQAGLPEDMRERVHLVSVSIDPEYDSPEVLEALARKLHVNLSHWTFVTGPEQAIAALNKTYSAQALPEGAAPLDHRTEVRLINAQGKLIQTYTGEPLDEARMVREIQSADRLFNQAKSNAPKSPTREKLP